MIDAAFDLPDEHQDSLTSTSTHQWNKSLDKSAASKMDKPTECIIRQLRSQIDSLAAVFSSMNDALNFSVHDIYYNLSKLIVVLISTSLQLIFLATARKNDEHVLF
jgi:hypothetical protein